MAKPKQQELTNEQKWLKDINAVLKGQAIENCRYMTEEEAEEMGFSARPLVIEFTSGHSIFAMADDEGNNGGAIATTYESVPTIPVF